MERLGPVLVDALLSIPLADDDERLGPVLVMLRSRYRQQGCD